MGVGWRWSSILLFFVQWVAVVRLHMIDPSISLLGVAIQ
jgi:hypothetical protein